MSGLHGSLVFRERIAMSDPSAGREPPLLNPLQCQIEGVNRSSLKRFETMPM